jgi:hypothetical protein
MNGETNLWKLSTLIFIGLLVLTGLSSFYFYSQLSLTEDKYRNTINSLDEISYEVDMLFNYGNGTKVWHNSSRIPIGFNLYNATELITNGIIIKIIRIGLG